jgi:hypothetical protein
MRVLLKVMKMAFFVLVKLRKVFSISVEEGRCVSLVFWVECDLVCFSLQFMWIQEGWGRHQSSYFPFKSIQF